MRQYAQIKIFQVRLSESNGTRFGRRQQTGFHAIDNGSALLCPPVMILCDKPTQNVFNPTPSRETLSG